MSETFRTACPVCWMVRGLEARTFAVHKEYDILINAWPSKIGGLHHAWMYTSRFRNNGSILTLVFLPPSHHGTSVGHRCRALPPGFLSVRIRRCSPVEDWEVLVQPISEVLPKYADSIKHPVIKHPVIISGLWSWPGVCSCCEFLSQHNRSLGKWWSVNYVPRSQFSINLILPNTGFEVFITVRDFFSGCQRLNFLLSNLHCPEISLMSASAFVQNQRRTYTNS